MLKYIELIAQHQPEITPRRDRLATAHVRDYPNLSFSSRDIDQLRKDMQREVARELKAFR